jgi:hypothetical protein
MKAIKWYIRQDGMYGRILIAPDNCYEVGRRSYGGAYRI